MARLLVAAIVLAACSSSTAPDKATPTTEATTSTTVAPDSPTPTATTPTSTPESDTGSLPTSSASPLRPEGEPVEQASDDSSTSAYISRVSMAADAIELTWSASTDGAVDYQIHRLERTSDSRPDLAAMTAANLIHSATEVGRFTDDTVDEGTRYWFGIRALSTEGTVLAHGWHRADAVTDTTPPDTVDQLTVEVVEGEALITWAPPEENYELHGYRVLRAVDGGELEPIATTWRLDQTSLIDDELPSAGVVTYGVEAFDFHWNDSEPGLVELDLN